MLFCGCWFGAGAVWGFWADIRMVSVAYWDLPTKNRGLPTIIGICRQKFRITNNFSDLPTKINHLPTILQKSTNFTRALLHGNAACQMTNCRRDGQTFFIRFNVRNLNISPIYSSFRPIFKYIVQINLISTKSTRYRRFFKNRQISPPPRCATHQSHIGAGGWCFAPPISNLKFHPHPNTKKPHPNPGAWPLHHNTKPHFNTLPRAQSHTF